MTFSMLTHLEILEVSSAVLLQKLLMAQAVRRVLSDQSPLYFIIPPA